MKEFFPEADTPNVRKTPAAWPHPMYVSIPPSHLTPPLSNS
jgi:hypothetical protein